MIFFQKSLASYRAFNSRNTKILEQSNELEWANIYHDTIRGRKWLEILPLSPGRWAANYSFLYILLRILTDYKPKSIVEFGLGETSKLISAFIENEIPESTHLIIEQSQEWLNEFNSRNSLCRNSTVQLLELDTKEIKSYPVKTYKNLQIQITKPFDLYVIDGPHGSEHYSRYDIYNLAENLQISDEFIIILDDYNRPGEQETAEEIIKLLKGKGLTIFSGVYSGNKSQMVIATSKYKYSTSL